ncbi:integral membrane protein-like protein, partial [Aureobasidium melanogenum]
MFGRKKRDVSPEDRVPSEETDRTLTPGIDGPTKEQLKRATRTRMIWALISSFFLLLTVIFMILVEVGCTGTGSVKSSIYFININLTNVFPESVPDSAIINSIAQTIGLHDFYHVGLWGFCEGYNGQGITDCSSPQTLYWFNPVQIILNQLLAGATIALPTDLTDILGLIKTVSHWMFGLFLAGACLSFVMIFLNPLAVFSRWLTLFTGIFTFLTALLITVATIIATVMFIIMQNAFTSVTELNIGANLGGKMFAFMWIATAFSIIAWLIQTSLCCCCASRRDVKRGKKIGSKKAWQTETPGVSEKESKRGFFGRKK